ncbi:MAG: hypothetical protein LBU53_01760 [Zoogloeaceae bacterium]|jgi:hypothetical protein|nr:hypothetical protein [Zoogloeaceae bacterium]
MTRKISTLLYAAAGVLVVALFAFAYYVLLVRTGLPEDEEMIAYFQAHRSDIEELVRRYRSFEQPRTDAEGRKPDGKPDWKKWDWSLQGDTQKLLKKTGIERIDFLALNPWLPNPYSLESARKLDALIEDPRDKTFSVFFKYGMLRIERNPRQKYRTGNIIYGVLWKEIIFVPEVPRIENGWLLGPLNNKGRYSFQSRVFSSLNRIPPRWESFECVFRQIEPNWFLTMCNGH